MFYSLIVHLFIGKGMHNIRNNATSRRSCHFLSHCMFSVEFLCHPGLNNMLMSASHDTCFHRSSSVSFIMLSTVPLSFHEERSLDESAVDFEQSHAILLSYCKSHQQCLVPGSLGPSVRLRSYHGSAYMPTL